MEPGSFATPGVQGISLGISNIIQLASLAVVANFLGPADLGQYALLLFLSGVVTQVFVVLSKAGTIRRVFGGGDDDDDDDEDDSQVSASPQRSLGVGILWSLVLGFGGAALMIAFSEPLADWLLGDDGQSIYVVWAAATVAFWPAAKLTSISIWFERRPTAFVIADASRPLIALIALVILLAAGAGIEGAIASTAFGVAGATVVGIFLLRRSFHPAVDLRETWEIAKQAKRRAPVVFPFWVIQNADVFLLSRVISETDLGIYTLASRLGLVVSFLPQGFRMAMRPLRKGAIFQAVSDEYGMQTQKGQLLGYFTLLCIFAVLVMILLGEVIVEIAPPEYADAAPLIPFAAGAFVMPAFYRTVNQNSTLPNNRRVFVAGCLGAMVIFCGLTYGLASEIGAYAAPIGMLIGFGHSLRVHVRPHAAWQEADRVPVRRGPQGSVRGGFDRRGLPGPPRHRSSRVDRGCHRPARGLPRGTGCDAGDSAESLGAARAHGALVVQGLDGERLQPARGHPLDPGGPAQAASQGDQQGHPGEAAPGRQGRGAGRHSQAPWRRGWSARDRQADRARRGDLALSVRAGAGRRQERIDAPAALRWSGLG